MNAFRKLCLLITAAFIVIAALLNLALRPDRALNGIYRVEAKRFAEQIEETGSTDLNDFPHLTGVFPESAGDLYTCDSPYIIIRAGGALYRVEYTTEDSGRAVIAANSALAAAFLLTVMLLLYLRRNIVKPFSRLNNVPQELAKGNLSVPIPEEKSRFFGKFTWGINLLRETVEKSRRTEMAMQRDKKLLLLSLSHDIKTPLSAIKLNAKALAKGLYTDPEKRREAAESINARADEIEHFVSQITKASSEDFMTFEVHPGEVFLSRIIDRLTERYAPQLELTGTEFSVEEYRDCLLSCDPDRLTECLQNLMENAVKYGDGRRIAVSFVEMDGCRLITVTNTGCTIQPKELPQIFSSFHRGSNSDGVPGNGLGLFICRKLMMLMGGEVYADIDGDSFSVTLVVRMA